MASDERMAEAHVYRLLGRLWSSEVDAELLSELMRTTMRQAFIAAGGALPPDDSRDTVERLAIDYCQLFVGPAHHLPPYQAVWTTGQFQGEATQSMQQFAELLGYESRYHGMMLDHLGVQLDMMGEILEGKSFSAADSSALREDVATHFFRAHLIWPDRLLSAAEAKAETDFYRAVVTMTRHFLQLQGDSVRLSPS